MAKRRMTKGGGMKVGGAKDGARPSKKHQVSALLPQNKVGGAKKRMAKMEKADMPV